MAFIKECSCMVAKSVRNDFERRFSTIEILRQRYVEEKQRSDRFEGHADR